MKVILSLLAFFLLQGCLPDSFVKFREDPPRANTGPSPIPSPSPNPSPNPGPSPGPGPNPNLPPIGPIPGPSPNHPQIQGLYYPQKNGDILILEVTPTLEITDITTGSVVTSRGAVGRIDHVDIGQEELHFELHVTVTQGHFLEGDGLDDADIFVESEARIDRVIFAFDSAISESRTPVVVRQEGDTTPLSFSISPNLEGGHTFDPLTGTITTDGTTVQQPTDYFVSVSNGGEAVKRFISFSTLPIKAPKTLRGIRYPQSEYVLLTVDNSSPFTVGGSLSSRNGPPGHSATIRYIDSERNRLYVRHNSNPPTYDFKRRDPLDNAPSFFVERTSIQSIENGMSPPAAGQPPITLTPTFTPDISTDLSTHPGSYTFSISPLPLPQGVTFNESTGVLEIASQANFPSQNFRIDSTDLRNRTYGENYSLGVTLPPQHLGYYENLLLVVDDSTPFSVGAYVTSVTAAHGDIPASDNLGIVTKRFSTGGTPPLALQHMIAIKVLLGQFAAEQHLDNVRPFAGAEAEVLDVTPYNIILTVSDSSGDGFIEGNLLTGGTSGASGLVTFNYDGGTGPGTSDEVFVIVTENDGATGFQLGESVGGQAIDRMKASHVKIDVTDASMADFYVGQDVDTNDNGVQGVINGRDDTAGVSTIDVTVHGGIFDNSTLTDVDNVNPFSSSHSAIESNRVRTDSYVELYRNDPMRLLTYLRNGGEGNAVYTISPTSLPEGLNFDIGTGIIWGTPRTPASKRAYTITALNLVGETTHKVALRVHNQFQLLDTTGAPSGFLHRAQQGHASSPCRITQDQVDAAILGSSGGNITRDIHCLLDIEELDLYDTGIKLKANVEGGMCDFVEFWPFSFFQYQYKHSPTTTMLDSFNHSCSDTLHHNRALCENNDARWISLGRYVRNDTRGCDGPVPADIDRYEYPNGDPVTSGDEEPRLCEANYQSDGDDDDRIVRPNCDDGLYDLEIRTWGNHPTLGTCSDPNHNNVAEQCTTAGNEFTPTCHLADTEVVNVECRGRPLACLRGPIRDIPELSAEDIEKYNRRYVRSKANTGFDGEWTFPSPLAKGEYTNMRLANYVSKNSCAGEFIYAMNSWESWSYLDDDQVPPFTNNPIYNYSDFNDPFKGGFPFYALICRDAASEQIARIRLQVREWDRDFRNLDIIGQDFVDFLDHLDPDSQISPSPDHMDSLGRDPFSGRLYNRYLDWDDFTNAPLTGCLTGTPQSNEMTLTGTLSVSAGGTVVTGSGTNFTTSLFPGDYIRPGGQGQVRMVIAIHSSTLLSVDRPFFNTVTGPANSSVRLNRFPFIEDGL